MHLHRDSDVIPSQKRNSCDDISLLVTIDHHDRRSEAIPFTSDNSVD